MPPDTNETKLRSGEQEPFPSADKNTDVDLVLFRAWGWVPAAISGPLDIPKFRAYHLL